MNANVIHVYVQINVNEISCRRILLDLIAYFMQKYTIKSSSITNRKILLFILVDLVSTSDIRYT